MGSWFFFVPTSTIMFLLRFRLYVTPRFHHLHAFACSLRNAAWSPFFFDSLEAPQSRYGFSNDLAATQALIVRIKTLQQTYAALITGVPS